MPSKSLKRRIHRCLKKIGYSEQGANDARKAMIYKHRDNRFRAYKCEYCPDWHIGKMNAESKFRIKLTFPEGWDF